MVFEPIADPDIALEMARLYRFFLLSMERITEAHVKGEVVQSGDCTALWDRFTATMAQLGAAHKQVTDQWVQAMERRDTRQRMSVVSLHSWKSHDADEATDAALRACQQTANVLQMPEAGVEEAVDSCKSLGQAMADVAAQLADLVTRTKNSVETTHLSAIMRDVSRHADLLGASALQRQAQELRRTPAVLIERLLPCVRDAESTCHVLKAGLATLQVRVPSINEEHAGVTSPPDGISVTSPSKSPVPSDAAAS